MGVSFDRRKSVRNIAERDLPFELVDEFEWSTALIAEDMRKDYGERRYQALGRIGERLHMLVFTPWGNDVRVISLRKANPKEVLRYEEAEREKASHE